MTDQAKRLRRNAALRKRYATPEGRALFLARVKKYRSKPGVREASYASQQKWRSTKAGKISRRRTMLKRTYGITLEEYDLLAAHYKGCWICGVAPKTRHHAVDHDHKTGLIRGILCHRCNRGLQMFVDKPERLDAAAAYLRANKAQVILSKARGLIG